MGLLGASENFFFKLSSLSLSSTIIYIHMQVLDGQNMIIAKFQEQIDNVSIMSTLGLFKYIEIVTFERIYLSVNLI